MSLVGSTGRITATIETGREGEVVLPVMGGYQAFPARSYDDTDGSVFKEGERVVVIEQQGRTVYVSAIV